MFIKVPTKHGEAVITIQHIVTVFDLQRTEKDPERGAAIVCQVANEVHHTYTTARAADVFAALDQVKP